MSVEKVAIAGRWQTSQSSGTFQADDPAAGEPLPAEYPISSWADVDAALSAAAGAFDELRGDDGTRVAAFLDTYAARIERRGEEIATLAHRESALALRPRLAEVELPRTTNQLRQAATAARAGAWRLPTIDAKLNIRSYYAGLGPVAVFGPNNFPLAFNSIAGGDFAAAIAAGNPVIAKANTSHPGTTRLLAEEAMAAVQETGLPPATVQLIYRTSHADGERFVADPRLGATGYTGSRSAGLKLKAAADAAGKPIYLELSSINPVVILPGAIAERSVELVSEFTGSCLMGTGQFCTNPGVVVLFAGESSERFIEAIAAAFRAAPVGTLLSRAVRDSLSKSVEALRRADAQVLAGGEAGSGRGYSYANTLLRVSGEQFIAAPHEFQTEAFGNASLVVVVRDQREAMAVLRSLEGNLTGCVYSARDGRDDGVYDELAEPLRRKVGRLLNDKMPTGVAVSPAMNHGGPFPATGHPGWTAVGIPASLRRFAALECFDNVRPHRLPRLLRDA